MLAPFENCDCVWVPIYGCEGISVIVRGQLGVVLVFVESDYSLGEGDTVLLFGGFWWFRLD